MGYIQEIGARAKAASSNLMKVKTLKKNEVLNYAADMLVENASKLIEANQKDVIAAKERNISEGLIDRLVLTEKRIEQMAVGLHQVAELKDVTGEVLSMETRPNGLVIGKKRVPIGVIGIIYESRPNVTADAFALCFKTNNAVILRGGSDAINSNKAIVDVLREAISARGVDPDVLLLVEKTDKETASEMMKLNQYIDVLIPRGGGGLINAVINNSTIPVIQTGQGNCHIYVEKTADLKMALDIIENAKTQRLGVCNACESLVVDREILKDFVPALKEMLDKHSVEIRADEEAGAVCDGLTPAAEEDFGKEYLDRIISVKTVSGVDEAIEHINRYSTHHSEAIITKDYESAMKFHELVDSAAVYVNASTRFTDGFEFGFGAEIGISTQKLHARGPMGLAELTTTKYIIFGNGQVRP